MCGYCEGERYRGVMALFNADLQRGMGDTTDWLVISEDVIVHVGASNLPDEERPLFRGCPESIASLSYTELFALEALSKVYGRPAIGKP